jgi:hypothetical protein
LDGEGDVYLLGRDLTVNENTLKRFKVIVKRDFNPLKPYPAYVLSMFTKKPLPTPPPSKCP